MRVLLFFWGTPADRPNEAQLHFAVQKAEVALQHTHELLKAICGRWHSPLYPQPRRHQQMVVVKTLNIKQPPFIFSPCPPSLTSLFQCFSGIFFFTQRLIRNRKWLVSFSECWVFLDICCFCVHFFARAEDHCSVSFSFLLFSVTCGNDVLGSLVVVSCGTDQTRVCQSCIWTLGSLEWHSICCYLLRFNRLRFLQGFQYIFFLCFPPYWSPFIHLSSTPNTMSFLPLPLTCLVHLLNLEFYLTVSPSFSHHLSFLFSLQPLSQIPCFSEHKHQSVSQRPFSHSFHTDSSVLTKSKSHLPLRRCARQSCPKVVLSSFLVLSCFLISHPSQESYVYSKELASSRLWEVGQKGPRI